MTAELRTAEGQLVFSGRGFMRIGEEIARTSDARKKVENFFNTMEEFTMDGDTEFIVWSFINGRRRRSVISTYYGDMEDGIEEVVFWPENADGRLSKNSLCIERNFRDEEKTEPNEGQPFRTYLATTEGQHILPFDDTPSQDDYRRLEEILQECADFDSNRKEISLVEAARFIGEVDTITITPLF